MTPRKRISTKKQAAMNIRMPAELRKLLGANAKNSGRSINKQILQILAVHYGRSVDELWAASEEAPLPLTIGNLGINP